MLYSILIFINIKNKNNCDCIYAILIILCVIISYTFWVHGTKNSLHHKIDGLYAKTLTVITIIYVLFIKIHKKKYYKLLFIFFVLMVSILFYHSNKYSKKKWCSHKHIITHGFFHLFVGICALFVFI